MWRVQTTRLLCLGSLVITVGACGTLPRGVGREPIRMRELVNQGDPARRASQRLIVEGLEADVQADRARAKGRYERAMQVDPTNPYAYLAFARHEIDRRRPDRAEAFLDQSRALFEASGGTPEGAEAHFVGLRGAVAVLRGQRPLAARDLGEARRLAPGVWGDGYLTAEELR